MTMVSGARGRCPWQLLNLIVFSILCLQSMADDAGSLVFIDSQNHRYLRSHPLQTSETSMSVMEVGAAVSILLGLAPPPMLSFASSSKLNELLLPNPFDKPHHVLFLEIGLAEDSQVLVYPNNFVFNNAIKSTVVRNSGSVEIVLPDTEGVAYFSLDEPYDDSNVAVTDKDLSDFASLFDGSYKSDTMKSVNGELTIPLPSCSKLSLHMSKKADRKFATGVVFLFNEIRKAAEMTKDLTESTSNFAELLEGYFEGIKVLQEEYRSQDIAHQGMELLFITVSKAVEILRKRYEGEIVGIIFFSRAHSSLPKRMLNVTYVSRPSLRFLEELKSSANITGDAEVALVRQTLAWTTGVLLLIAILIGGFLLINMPLTRDTLLYSNVKLD